MQCILFYLSSMFPYFREKREWHSLNSSHSLIHEETWPLFSSIQAVTLTYDISQGFPFEAELLLSSGRSRCVFLSQLMQTASCCLLDDAPIRCARDVEMNKERLQ